MQFQFKSLKTFHFKLEHSKPLSVNLSASASLPSEDLELLRVFAGNRKCSVEEVIGDIVHNWLIEQNFLKKGTVILTNGDGKALSEFPDSERGISDAASFAVKLYLKDKEKYPNNGGFSFVEVCQNGKKIPHLQKIGIEKDGTVIRA